MVTFVCFSPRSDLVEKNAMLRTKAMREKEEQRERRKYNYTLLRIRLPDGNLLQGQHVCLKSLLNMENPVWAEVEVICACV